MKFTKKISLPFFFFGVILAFSSALFAQSACVSNQVIVHEIYASGGLTGATFTNDFVELFNVSSTACSLTNFSIQVASGNANNFPNVFGFPNGSTIPGRGFFLIQFASGGSAGSVLPSADFTAATDLSTSGKVALVASVSSLTGNCASNLTNAIDYVGYGTTNCSAVSPAAAPTKASAIQRISIGYNTDNNQTDFSLRTPSPNNTLSPTASDAVVSGRLQIYGRGLSGATVTMTDELGEVSVARTNQLGYFKFSDVRTGQTYVFEVSSKKAAFAPNVITVNEDIYEMDFQQLSELFKFFAPSRRF